MDDTITTIYCLCDDFLKAINHRRDDPQVRLSTAEVMTVPLVAATFFGGNIDKTCRFLREYGYMPKMISKGRFNHRLHAIEAVLWQGLFALLAEVFKQHNPERTYAVDSLPVPVCDNILRSAACRIYPPEEETAAAGHNDGTPERRGRNRFVATSRANGATSTACECTWW